MNTDSFTSGTGNSFFGSIMDAITLSLRRSSSNGHVAALATSLASELRAEPGVAELVIELSKLSRAQRNAALLRAARFFRSDWNTFGIADTLRRLTRSDLFLAVVRELEAHTEGTETFELNVAPQFREAQCSSAHRVQFSN